MKQFKRYHLWGTFHWSKDLSSVWIPQPWTLNKQEVFTLFLHCKQSKLCILGFIQIWCGQHYVILNILMRSNDFACFKGRNNEICTVSKAHFCFSGIQKCSVFYKKIVLFIFLAAFNAFFQSIYILCYFVPLTWSVMQVTYSSSKVIPFLLILLSQNYALHYSCITSKLLSLLYL